MANEKRMIDANALISNLRTFKGLGSIVAETLVRFAEKQPTVDAVEVVRCQNCLHAEPLDRNCTINTCHYMHCKLWRGDETKNVWHKYKKYYKDYSLVERDGYCDAGAKMDGGNDDG